MVYQNLTVSKRTTTLHQIISAPTAAFHNGILIT